MYLQNIPENAFTTTLIKIKYDCCGQFERCGKEWTLKLKDAKKNFESNNGKHLCHKCTMKANNPMKKLEIKEKIKKTNLEKYGTTLAMNSKENIIARVEKMFGTEEATKNIVEKRKQTSIKRYGADHIMKTQEGKERVLEVFQEKYGETHPMKVEEVKNRMRSTMFERHGVKNPMHSQEIKDKMVKTNFERYGVDYYNQLPEMREYLRLNCSEWLKESWKSGGPMKGIIRPEDWNKKQRETVAKRIANGNWSGGFQSNCRGRYNAKKCKKQNPRFLSSLELQMHYFLDNNPFVDWYDYECISIQYLQKDGTNHLYFPDFLVKFKDEEISHIIETKTWKEKDSINVKLKQEAAIEYANSNNMTYTILFDEDIKEFGINLEYIKKLPEVILENTITKDLI